MSRAADSLAERLGLHRPEFRAWAMYDWANSAFVTTVIGTVFPIYYAEVAAQGLPPERAAVLYSSATTLALIVVACLAPVLGAMADTRACKKRLLALCQSLGVLACLAMVFITEGRWQLALVLFALGNIGVSGAFTFYDSLLPHIARQEELDRVSTAGYALGYMGGGFLLAINLLWIQKPGWFGLADARAAARLSLASAGVWWLVFSVPLFLRVSEPAVVTPLPGRSLVVTAFRQLGETFRELRRFKSALLMLVAFLIYNDGINTIIRMAALYGKQIGIASPHLILAFLMVQFVGIPFAFLFGRLASRIGAKQAVFVALLVYTLISVLGYYMTRALHFYLLAFLVGTVQGGSQALSRSLFASLIPRQKSSECFAFFAVFEKFAGVIGPAVFATAVGTTGSMRAAILSVITFFALGALLLAMVDVGQGQRIAREAETALASPVPDGMAAS